MAGFGERLQAALAEHGPLCVGIDPHPALLESVGLEADVEGLREFAQRCVAAFAGRVAAVKPQSALFEAFGAAGIAVLEEAIAGLRAAGTLVVLDAKRGDIGSTNAGYARAWFGEGAPLRCDAVTLSPYLGPESLDGIVAAARADGAGAFVLCRTSNPEAAAVQTALVAEGETVARSVARWAAGHDGDVGLVVGITVADARRELDLDRGEVPLLVPGFGAQGGAAADLVGVLGEAAAGRSLASVSRDVLRHAGSVEELVEAVDGWASAFAGQR